MLLHKYSEMMLKCKFGGSTKYDLVVVSQMNVEIQLTVTFCDRITERKGLLEVILPNPLHKYSHLELVAHKKPFEYL